MSHVVSSPPVSDPFSTSSAGPNLDGSTPANTSTSTTPAPASTRTRNSKNTWPCYARTSSATRTRSTQPRPQRASYSRAAREAVLCFFLAGGCRMSGGRETATIYISDAPHSNWMTLVVTSATVPIIPVGGCRLGAALGAEELSAAGGECPCDGRGGHSRACECDDDVAAVVHALGCSARDRRPCRKRRRREWHRHMIEPERDSLHGVLGANLHGDLHGAGPNAGRR